MNKISENSNKILFIVLILSGLTIGLTVKDASIEELSVESDLIVRGKVNAISYEWDNKKLNKINTRIKLNVTEYLKGEGISTLEIVQMGGKIDDVEDIIYGTPKLNLNEELLLFLVKKNNNYVIHSITLGCYRISTNDKLQQIATNNLHHVNLISDNKENIPLKQYLLNKMYQKIEVSLN